MTMMPPKSLHWLLTIIALFLMGVILLTERPWSSNRMSEDILTHDWIEDAIFVDGFMERIFYWECRPVTVVIDDQMTERQKNDVRQILDEMEAITGGTFGLIRWNDAGSDECEKVFIAVSPTRHFYFENFYSDVFKEIFGDDEFEYWSKKSAFEFPFIEKNPCFSFGLYQTDDFRQENFNVKSTPHIGMAAVGHAAILDKKMYMHCLREELAHMLFFIPDRYVEDGRETIFNLNPVDDEIHDFSAKDRFLMRFIYQNPEIAGMDRDEFRQFLEAFEH
jgi:hypothetical protein